jgi:predicted RNA-binding Zn ribbon-like protein
LSGVLIPAPREDLCLGYANTLSWRGSDAPVEKLGGLDDLLRWLDEAAAMSSASVAEARDRSSRDPAMGTRLLAEAIALREAIFRVFSAVASASAVADGDLATLNHALAGAPPRLRLGNHKVGHAWSCDRLEVSVASLLGPILWSAADLLVQANHRLVRRCANDACRRLFIDQSKGGTRRWCDMTACGNRAKARRHYLKSKAS